MKGNPYQVKLFKVTVETQPECLKWCEKPRKSENMKKFHRLRRSICCSTTSFRLQGKRGSTHFVKNVNNPLLSRWSIILLQLIAFYTFKMGTEKSLWDYMSWSVILIQYLGFLEVIPPLIYPSNGCLTIESLSTHFRLFTWTLELQTATRG